MRNAKTILSGVCLLGVAVAFAGTLSTGKSSMAGDLSLNPVRASVEGNGDTPRLIRVTYRIPADAEPGIVVVYAQPLERDAAGKTPDPILVNRIFPFTPAGPDGLRKSVVQIPTDVAKDLRGKQNFLVAVSLQRADGTVLTTSQRIIDSATIVN